METVFKGIVYEVLRKKVKSADGTERELEFINSKNVVRVYPITPDRRSIFLIREKRPGTDEVALRAVSGGIEEKETCLQTAERELREETGITASTFEHFHTSRQSLKALNLVYHVAAYGSEVRLGQELDQLEQIDVEKMDLNRVNDLIWSGGFPEDYVAFALLKLQRSLE